MKNLLKTLFKKHFEITEPREEVSLRTPRYENGENGNKDLLTCIKDIMIENEKLMNIRERLEHSRRSGKDVERLIKNFLPCLDSFERILFLARNHPPSEELDNWLKSVEGLFYRIKRTLENAGLNEIETIGKKVDLDLHEVVDYIPTNEYANDTVIRERQKGYFFNGKLLRVAQVVIAHNERS